MIKGVNGRAEGRFLFYSSARYDVHQKIDLIPTFRILFVINFTQKKYNVYLVCMRTLSDTPYSLVFPP